MRRPTASFPIARAAGWRLTLAACLCLFIGGERGIETVRGQENAVGEPARAFVVAQRLDDGTVRIALALRGTLSGNARLHRRALPDAPDSAEEMVWVGAQDALLVDAPPRGHIYEYDVSDADRILFRVRVDLRRAARLRFLGGTTRRGLFEYIAADGRKRRFVAPVGKEINGTLLDEKGEAVDIVTPFRLEAVGLAPRRERREVKLTPTARDGKPLSGLDGKPLLLQTWTFERGVESVFQATLKRGDKTLRLQERDDAAWFNDGQQGVR